MKYDPVSAAMNANQFNFLQYERTEGLGQWARDSRIEIMVMMMVTVEMTMSQSHAVSITL
jgi:hypothetical protein